MNEDSRFREREVVQTFTEEFFTSGCPHIDDPLEAVEEASRWVERNYNCVAAAREYEGRLMGVSKGYEMVAIAAQDADVDEIKRGVQSAHHYISNME